MICAVGKDASQARCPAVRVSAASVDRVRRSCTPTAGRAAVIATMRSGTSGQLPVERHVDGCERDRVDTRRVIQGSVQQTRGTHRRRREHVTDRRSTDANLPLGLALTRARCRTTKIGRVLKRPLELKFYVGDGRLDVCDRADADSSVVFQRSKVGLRIRAGHSPARTAVIQLLGAVDTLTRKPRVANRGDEIMGRGGACDEENKDCQCLCNAHELPLREASFREAGP